MSSLAMIMSVFSSQSKSLWSRSDLTVTYCILNIWVHAMHLNLIIANEISQSINQFMFKWVDVLVAITTPIKNSTLKPIYPHSLWMLHQIARPRHYHWKVHSVLQQYPVQDSCLKPRIDVTCCTISLVSSAWSLFMWDAKKTEGLDQLLQLYRPF